MKVYQINVVCGSGSTGRIVVDLAQSIQEHGGNCRIAYGRGNASEKIDAIRVSNKVDLYAHAILTRLTDKHGLFSKRATKRLIQDILDYNPDIIHIHNIHGYYVNYEMLFRFLKECNKPIVWTLHDCWAFTGHCAYFDYVGCDKWKDKCFACPQKKRYPHSILLDNSENNFQRKKKAFSLPVNMTIVTVSEWLKNVTEQSFLQKYFVKKICNGVDLSIMQPTENRIREQYHLENKKIVLGVAYVWEERKGLYTFYELAQHLSEQYQIVLIGLNEHQMNEKPEKILGIQKVLDPREMAKWYTVADVYVNASVEETMGLTTVEAMACGTPVIVMNATASPELLNRDCGLVVEPENLEQLSAAVSNMKKEDKVTESCIKRAGDFEKAKQYEKYLQLYRELTSGVETRNR